MSLNYYIDAMGEDKMYIPPEDLSRKKIYIVYCTYE